MESNIYNPIRQSILILLVTCFSFPLFSQFLSPSENVPLYQHMMEVNKEWSKQNVDQLFFGNLSTLLVEKVSFKNDTERIQMHLMLVEKILRESNKMNFSQEATNQRNHHLDVLKNYWQRGVFPKNIYHKKRQPYFVDHHNTACAVGHLVREDGAIEFVEKIKTENNFAYIAELKNEYPALQTWASNNGFTIDELAWIQPGYPPGEQEWHRVGNDEGIEGKINVMKTVGDKLVMAGSFTSVDGVAANNIIAWDGNDWHTFGDGVVGEIFAIERGMNDEIIIGGDFKIGNSDFSNIAMWKSNEWIGLQEGDMNGAVYALRLHGDLYAGGDFQFIDNQPIGYIAKKDLSGTENWNNHVYKNISGVVTLVEDALSVNGVVHALEIVEDKILVGGEFTKTAMGTIQGGVNKLDTRYLGYWTGNNWATEFDGLYPFVKSIGYHDEQLVIGGEVGSEQSISIFNENTWQYNFLTQLDVNGGDGLVHGFIVHDGRMYAYGDLSNQPIVGTYSDGFIELFNNATWGGGGANFDKTVRAMEVFDDNVYFAGDFTSTSISSPNQFNGLTYSSLDGITSVENKFLTNNLHVYHSSENLYVNYENLDLAADLNIYNLQGQLIKTINLQAGTANEIFELPDWNTGIYVYQVVNEYGQQSGKFVSN